MKPFIFIFILGINIHALAVDGVVNTTAYEKELQTFVMHHLSARSGFDLHAGLIDKKESKFSVERNVKEQEVATAIEDKQFINAADGSLILKKDVIHELSVEGTYYFTNGLACSVGSAIQVSTVYKKPPRCRISAMCTLTKKVEQKGIAKDINFSLKDTDCSVFRARNDDSETAEDATSVAQ